MNQKLFFIVLFLAFVASSAKAKKLNGTYATDGYSHVIVITGDTLTVYSCDFLTDFWDGDIKDCTFYPAAKCICTQIDKHVLEISSVHDQETDLWGNYRKTEYLREPGDTSQLTEVNLIFPNYKADLLIDFYDADCDTVKGGYFSTSINQNTNSNSLFLSIRPTYYTPSNFAMQYFGLLEYSCIDLFSTVSFDKIKRIDIEFPNITPIAFAQYFLYKDYMLLSAEGLKWNGLLYRRCRDKEAREHELPRIAKEQR